MVIGSPLPPSGFPMRNGWRSRASMVDIRRKAQRRPDADCISRSRGLLTGVLEVDSRKLSRNGLEKVQVLLALLGPGPIQGRARWEKVAQCCRKGINRW